MKKILFPILFVLVVLAFSAQSVAAQAVEPPKQLAYYDAQIEVLMPKLESFQADYHSITGGYYQALESHSAAPNTPTAPDGISKAPTDQDANLAYFWTQFATLPDQLAWSFRIDTYSGPDGDGYVLTVTTVVNGATWQRSINRGPDAWRDQNWHDVTPQPF